MIDQKRERMKGILATAERMCSEIVWADFPGLPVKGLDRLVTCICNGDRNIEAIRVICRFAAATDDAAAMVDDRDIEHQAASLIQSSVKWLARNWLTANGLVSEQRARRRHNLSGIESTN